MTLTLYRKNTPDLLSVPSSTISKSCGFCPTSTTAPEPCPVRKCSTLIANNRGDFKYVKYKYFPHAF